MSDQSKNVPKILVVCMGNICRSPTGEAILRFKAAERELALDVDSAGTIGFHEGKRPDPRSQKAGEMRGYSFSGIRSRRVKQSDFLIFDLILAADKANLADLIDICPPEYRHKITLFMSHGNSEFSEIPDPYFGGEQGFARVLDLIEDASESILDLCEKK